MLIKIHNSVVVRTVLFYVNYSQFIVDIHSTKLKTHLICFECLHYLNSPFLALRVQPSLPNRRVKWARWPVTLTPVGLLVFLPAGTCRFNCRRRRWHRSDAWTVRSRRSSQCSNPMAIGLLGFPSYLELGHGTTARMSSPHSTRCTLLKIYFKKTQQ